MGKYDQKCNDCGNDVLCDFCNKDWSESDKSGGFLFNSKAVCPDCSERMLESIKKYDEVAFIKGRCPAEMSFSNWVRKIRG